MKIKFLLKMFYYVAMFYFICKTLNGIAMFTEHSCTDTQTITKLEPMFARRKFKYLITGDKGTKTLSSDFASEGDTLKLKVGDQYCFKDVYSFNWNKFFESFTKL
nr:MAG TPA: hypothetical protein [Caudoviricetes sp.]